MALSPTQEAQVLQLVAEQAALLSLADNEATIISKLGATKVNLSSLGSAATFDDADIMLIRQGTTDLSIAGSVVKAAVAVPDASETVKGKVELATAAEVIVGTDATRAVTPAGLTGVIGSKIQSLATPSLAANAMTIGVNPTTIDFRSATLASPIVNTRKLAALASLTIPSGATLGAISGQSADFVVGLLDNAGTLEPFVCNLAGGINLDETTLISTTTISAGATSAGVAYSTTGRTALPFRVVGIYRNTQAVAGTYVTTPSLVQGVGGQALAAMSSIGFGQTWQTVTRDASTTYYNTTGRTIALATLASGNVSGGSGTITVNGVAVTIAQSGSNETLNIDALIPPGASYSISVSGGATLSSSKELR